MPIPLGYRGHTKSVEGWFASKVVPTSRYVRSARSGSYSLWDTTGLHGVWKTVVISSGGSLNLGVPSSLVSHSSSFLPAFFFYCYHTSVR
ncbi:hypothetical protein TNCV_2461251 [Trichonephila clavipes]|nr:hypothetical protein TNCV_2461251 [Trichonephila clavipes]